MQVILTEEEFIDLKKRAIDKDEFSKWKTSVSDKLAVFIKLCAQIMRPSVSWESTQIKEIKNCLRSVEDEINTFPFEKIIKQ